MNRNAKLGKAYSCFKLIRLADQTPFKSFLQKNQSFKRQKTSLPSLLVPLQEQIQRPLRQQSPRVVSIPTPRKSSAKQQVKIQINDDFKPLKRVRKVNLKQIQKVKIDQTQLAQFCNSIWRQDKVNNPLLFQDYQHAQHHLITNKAYVRFQEYLKEKKKRVPRYVKGLIELASQLKK